jgi:hypothetical protein
VSDGYLASNGTFRRLRRRSDVEALEIPGEDQCLACAKAVGA